MLLRSATVAPAASTTVNNRTVLSYNQQGAMTGIEFADGSSVSYTRDAAGRVTRVADGQGKGLDFGYNHQGLVTVVSNAYGLVRLVVYDVQDHPIQVTDANGVTVTNQFDGLGRLTAVTNANQAVTRVAYNSVDEVTDLWDGRTNHTIWHYNQYGWLSNKVDALGREVLRCTYYPNGRVASRWTPQMGDTAYTWDATGNLETISNEVSSVSYSYNERNQKRMMVDPVGTTLFTYTPAGQLKTEDGPWAGDTLTWGYTNGLRTSLSLGSAGFGYEYDSSWRLKTLTSPAGTFSYGYNLAQGTSPAALVRTISLPNSAWITNHYDGLSRLDYTALVNRWGHVLDGCGYGHDALGLRINIVRDLGLTNSSVTVGYDSTGQLISWRAREGLSGPLRQNEQIQCVFDPAGNLRYRTNGGLVQTFNCDAANQLTNVTRTGTLTVSGATPAPAASVTVNGQAAQQYGDMTFAATNLSVAEGTNTFIIIATNIYGLRVTNIQSCNLSSSVGLAWDSNGNLTNDGTRSFAYSPENQLTNITVAGQWKVDFVYDGLGRRRVQRDYGRQGGEWVKINETRYIYDGYLLIQERNSNNVVRVTYTRGVDLSSSLAGAGGIGGLLARTDGSGSTLHHADGAGNITALMDGQQNMAARYMYAAFGRLVGQWGSLASANVVQFSSMPTHRLSGTVGYWGRPYDPNLQRWLSRDPIGEAGGVNLYGFVGNNPLSWIDPLGLDNQNPTPAEMNANSINNGPVNIVLTLTPIMQPTPPVLSAQGSPVVRQPEEVPTGRYLMSSQYGGDDPLIQYALWAGGMAASLYGPELLGAKALPLLGRLAKCKVAKNAIPQNAAVFEIETQGGMLTRDGRILESGAVKSRTDFLNQTPVRRVDFDHAHGNLGAPHVNDLHVNPNNPLQINSGRPRLPEPGEYLSPTLSDPRIQGGVFLP